MTLLEKLDAWSKLKPGDKLPPELDTPNNWGAAISMVLGEAAAALRAERERCAGIADAYAARCERGSAVSSMAEDSWGAVAARAIAKAIRGQL